VRSVFIHIPKTAGSYIMEALRLKNCALPRNNKRFRQRGGVTFGHQDYLRLVAKGIVSKRFHQKSFKFASCRNPYDRVVSHYFYTKSRHKELLGNKTFLEFTRMFAKVETPEIFRANGRIPNKVWFRPQVEPIRNIDMDYIIRYENLDADVNHVANILGVDLKKIGKRRISRHRAYRKYYNAESIRNVQKYYRQDFEFFRYDYNILY